MRMLDIKQVTYYSIIVFFFEYFLPIYGKIHCFCLYTCNPVEPSSRHTCCFAQIRAVVSLYASRILSDVPLKFLPPKYNGSKWNSVCVRNEKFYMNKFSSSSFFFLPIILEKPQTFLWTLLIWLYWRNSLYKKCWQHGLWIIQTFLWWWILRHIKLSMVGKLYQLSK